MIQMEKETQSVIITGILWALVFGLLLFLTFNRHSRSGYFNYRSEIFNDMAGYYMYSPATFIYGFDANKFPDSLDVRLGGGFELDYETGKVSTKYTCGVAILQSPFFLLAHGLAGKLGQERSGYSPVYHWSVNVAAVFYVTVGLFFLFQFLRFHYSRVISALSCLLVLVATNLYYYSIDDTGLSHVYSFFLFCAFIYLIKSSDFLRTDKKTTKALIAFLAGMIVLIRPTNVIFLSSFLFLDAYDWSTVAKRLSRAFALKNSWLLAIALIPLIPQFLYWNYLEGSFILYSYGDEGFNWLTPQFLKTWFSPRSGLFTYTPFFFLVIAAILLMIVKRKVNGVFLLILFILTSYVFASWSSWTFGCSFGGRSFVEYLALFSIPIAFLLDWLRTANRAIGIVFTLLIVLVLGFNLKMSYTIYDCVVGIYGWDWSSYLELVQSGTR